MRESMPAHNIRFFDVKQHFKLKALFLLSINMPLQIKAWTNDRDSTPIGHCDVHKCSVCTLTVSLLRIIFEKLLLESFWHRFFRYIPILLNSWAISACKTWYWWWWAHHLTSKFLLICFRDCRHKEIPPLYESISTSAGNTRWINSSWS